LFAQNHIINDPNVFLHLQVIVHLILLLLFPYEKEFRHISDEYKDFNTPI